MNKNVARRNWATGCPGRNGVEEPERVAKGGWVVRMESARRDSTAVSSQYADPVCRGEAEGVDENSAPQGNVLSMTGLEVTGCLCERESRFPGSRRPARTSLRSAWLPRSNWKNNYPHVLKPL